MRSIRILIFTFILAVGIASCAGGDPEAAAVAAYLEGIVAQVDVMVTNFSCSDWEFDALLEMDSFLAVSPQLKDLSCSVVDSDAESAAVNCSGTIIATYNDEAQELDLSIRTYRVIQEAGEWVVCGYQ